MKKLLIDRFIIRHWQGNFSLGVAYWLIGFAVSAVSIAVILPLDYAATNMPYDPIILFTIFISVWFLIICLSTWQIAGTWRSATHSNSRWSNVAKFMLILGAFQLARTLANTAIPQTIAIFNIAFNGDSSLPEYHITLSEASSELIVEGGFKYGLARDFETVLQSAPDVRVISFKSLGGRIGEAEKLFHIISQRHLNTVTNTYCLSACTIAFAGGVDRWVGPYAKLGFHSGQFVSLTNAQMRESGDNIIRAEIEKNGTPRRFYDRAQAVPPGDLWYPTKDELLQNHIITQAVSRAPSSLHIINMSLRAAMEKLNASLPRTVDSVTTLVSSEVVGTDFTYIFEIPPYSEIYPNSHAFSQYMSQYLTKNVCGNASMKADVENGVTYSYEYMRKGEKAKIYHYDVSECSH